MNEHRDRSRGRLRRQIVRSVRLALIGLLLASAAGTAARAGAHVAEINGFRMHYELHGEGPPLVLLHGFTASGTVWEPFVDDLARHYRLIIPDLRGHGRSSKLTGAFTHRQSAADVFALLDHLKIETFRAMGISTGGMTLLHMATRQPGRVEAMVLIGATHYFPEEARAIMRQTTVEGLSEEDWEWHRRIHTGGDEQIRALIEQFHAFKDSYEDMNFTPPLLSTITARTLIVHGDRDEFFPVEIPVEMYRAIPHSALWIVPGGGHVPIFDRQETAFRDTALEFLRGDLVTE